MTVGQPRLLLPHQKLAIAAETRSLWLGDLDCVGAPDQLPEEIAGSLADADVASINELLANREQSQFYRLQSAAPAALTWGIQQQRETDRRCAGLTILGRIEPLDAWPMLQQAESYGTLFHAEHIGSGLGRVAYERTCALGLAAGLDSIFASVNLYDTRSVRLHKACGFIGLGVYPLGGQSRLDMRLYNPAIEEVMIHDWVHSTVSQLRAPDHYYTVPAEQELRNARETTKAVYDRHKDLSRIIVNHRAVLDQFMAE